LYNIDKSSLLAADPLSVW